MTLGIFLKVFKLFDRACRRLDYRLMWDAGDEETDQIMDELFYREEKIANFEESLAVCTDTYTYQLSQLSEDDEDERKELETTYMEHRQKVEDLLKRLVILYLVLQSFRYKLQ